jgi:RNA polymerase sigma-70 factor (ECF subfamily)
VARPEGRLTAVFAAQHGLPKGIRCETLPLSRVPVKSSAAQQFRPKRVRDRGCAGRRTTIIAAIRVGRLAIAAHQEIANFLAEVERRAFKQALFAVRDEDAALDIVQDAMLRLTEKYAAKPLQELPMLFQRILQNAIHDHFRRQKVRSTWTTLLSALGQKDERDEDFDPLETLPARGESNPADPAQQHEQAEVVGLVEQALARLPARQREAFLLRYWEELDVAETATAMGCSEGSVKTHCSRAVHALAEMLKAKGIGL